MNAALQVQTKMASVIVTLKIMPESPDSDLDNISNLAQAEIKKFSGSHEIKAVQEPIAFGLKALNIMFVMPEQKGSTDELEKKINNIDGVNSVECTDVRRAIG